VRGRTKETGLGTERELASRALDEAPRGGERRPLHEQAHRRDGRADHRRLGGAAAVCTKVVS